MCFFLVAANIWVHTLRKKGTADFGSIWGRWDQIHNQTFGVHYCIDKGCYQEQKKPEDSCLPLEMREWEVNGQKIINPKNKSQIWIYISLSDSSWDYEVKTCSLLGQMSYLQIIFGVGKCFLFCFFLGENVRLIHLHL